MEKWVIAAKRADFNQIGQQFHIDPVIARLIRNRDVIGEDKIREYLSGTVQELPSPWLMKDMEKAVDILEKKISQKAKVRIIGDYDIDGVCFPIRRSASVMILPYSISTSAPKARNPLICWSIGRLPILHPPGSATSACLYFPSRAPSR